MFWPLSRAVRKVEAEVNFGEGGFAVVVEQGLVHVSEGGSDGGRGQIVKNHQVCAKQEGPRLPWTSDLTSRCKLLRSNRLFPLRRLICPTLG